MTYVGVTATAGYVRGAEIVESAIDSATRWAKAQPAAAPAVSFAALSREEIRINARKQGILIDPGKLSVSQSGRTVSIAVRWAQAIFTAVDELVVLALRLSLPRNFEIRWAPPERRGPR